MENEAISDIILEMTQFQEMKKLNDSKNEKLKLYIISKLDTTTAWSTKPTGTGYNTSANGIDYSKKIIEENKKEFEESLTKYKKEEELFINLKNGKIKRRDLNYSFQNKNLSIQLIEVEKTETFETKENEFGYLFISRIVFNKSFTKGYLHFKFFCGIGCAWNNNNNIEIKKINGKWKITEYFSGGIA